MRITTALNTRWTTVLVVVVVLIIVGISGLAMFQWYIARVDASLPLPHLPAQDPAAKLTPMPPNERVHSEFPPAPSAEEKARIFESDFQLIKEIAALPEAAKALFRSWDGKRLAMADPGESWQAGCVGDGNLPMERLIFAGVSPDFAFVYYEAGGIGHSYQVEVYRVFPSGWQPYWSQYVPDAAHDIKQLRKLVAVPEDSCCASHKPKAKGKTTAR